jgi:hypothetical protein
VLVQIALDPFCNRLVWIVGQAFVVERIIYIDVIPVKAEVKGRTMFQPLFNIAYDVQTWISAEPLIGDYTQVGVC